MFSVIIPVYNGAKFIDGAIESVKRQKFCEYEIVIINDGSVDDTPKVLEKYNDDESITVINQKNAGVSAARNTGIEHARYPYITFLDADDIWRENHLEVLKEMIDRYPEAGMYCTFGETLLPNGKVINSCRFFENRPETVLIDDFFEEYDKDKSAKMFNVISTCVSAEAAKQTGGFPVGCKIGEDLEFSLRVAAYCKVVLTKRCTTLYQKTNSNATKDVSFDPDWSFFDTVTELYEDTNISDKKKENIRRVMNWFTIRRCRHYIIDLRKSEAVKAYKSIGRTHLKKDKFVTALLLLLPCKLVNLIFKLRWRSRA